MNNNAATKGSPLPNLDSESLPKILCVDDEKNVLESLERALRSNFVVFTAQSGEKGLEILQNEVDISVVLTDHRMPGISGIDFLQKVRTQAPSAVRVILSGQMDIEEIPRAINDSQVHRLVLKPWDNEYLRIQMLEALQTQNLIQERESYRQLAITDPVTRLTNHRYFQDSLREELSQARKYETKLSLIMVDVDHFKSFNDHYGHPEGDRLLLSIAQKISECFPPKYSASRYGGEEFAIVLPETELVEAEKMAEKLRNDLQKTAFKGPYGRPAFITVSLGISAFPQHGWSAEDLISTADSALYQAKRQGRNQTVISN